jgi:hypothetical protein
VVAHADGDDETVVGHPPTVCEDYLARLGVHVGHIPDLHARVAVPRENRAQRSTDIARR